MLGAERVIAIDRVPERLDKAKNEAKAEVDQLRRDRRAEKLKEMTGGRGPDSCMDAVGMEAHGTSIDALYDRAKQAVRLETDRPHVLRQAIQACRKGGTVSIPGVYGGLDRQVPDRRGIRERADFEDGPDARAALSQAAAGRVVKGEIDPSFIITHRLKLDEGPKAYATFRRRKTTASKW